jgi:hypothetical protein
LFGGAGCVLGSSGCSFDSSFEEEKPTPVAPIGEIISTQLFEASEVPVYNGSVGDYKGVMVGYIGSDRRNGVLGEYMEDFEVFFDGVFQGDTEIEYIYPLSQWSSTQFIVCDLEGNELFGFMHDWLALSQAEFFDLGYLIDYTQSPLAYYAQGNTYYDLYEAKLAKHVVKPIYNQAEASGNLKIEFLNENNVKVSMSVSDNSKKELTNVFSAREIKNGYRIKIKDARQMILDYREETGADITSEYRTCVLVVGVNGINVGKEKTEVYETEKRIIAYTGEYVDGNGNTIIEIKQGEEIENEFYIAKIGGLLGKNGVFETRKSVWDETYPKFSCGESFAEKEKGEYPLEITHEQTGLTKNYTVKIV